MGMSHLLVLFKMYSLRSTYGSNSQRCCFLKLLDFQLGIKTHILSACISYPADTLRLSALMSTTSSFHAILSWLQFFESHYYYTSTFSPHKRHTLSAMVAYALTILLKICISEGSAVSSPDPLFRIMQLES